MSERVIELDVRPLLAAGEEPLSAILEAAEGLPEDGALRLTASLEPVPLYFVLSRRGFAAVPEDLGNGDWMVTFVRTGITPDSTVADVHDRYPSTAPVLAAHGFDLCCGGGRTLAFVAAAHGVELPSLLAELQTAAVADVPATFGSRPPR